MSTIRTNTLLAADGSTTTEPSIPALDQRMAKAWVTFRKDTDTILSSYGVSSLIDVDINNTKINFTTAFSDTSYCLVTNAANSTSNPAEHNASAIPLSTTQCQVELFDSTPDPVESDYVAVVAFSN